MTRTLFDCPAVPLSPAGPAIRMIVATHPATPEPPPVGEQRGKTVYELFVSTLPSRAFSAKDVLDLYLHRGSFETILSDEDDEQDADRWVSHTAWGQECFQILGKSALEPAFGTRPASGPRQRAHHHLCSGSRGFASRSP